MDVAWASELLGELWRERHGGQDYTGGSMFYCELPRYLTWCATRLSKEERRGYAIALLDRTALSGSWLDAVEPNYEYRHLPVDPDAPPCAMRFPPSPFDHDWPDTSLLGKDACCWKAIWPWHKCQRNMVFREC